MYRWRLRLQSLFRIDHRREWFIRHLDQLCRVLSLIAAGGDHRGHPFAGIARLVNRQGIPEHIG